MNPEGVAKRACFNGWKAYAFRATKTYCPSCAGPPKISNDAESEIRKVIPMSVQPIKAAETKIVEVRDPTGDQRVQIRGHLDKSFDDNVGMYLDGMSDARIAELVGVPRLIVERMREAAYGPIKVDPLVAGMRNELLDMKREVDGQQKGLDQIKTKMAELGSRIEKLAMGRAV